MPYVAIRIDSKAAEILNKYAAEKRMTKSQAITHAIEYETSRAKSYKDEAAELLERADYEAEHPECLLSDEDRELFEQLEPGELPECCQEYYISGEKCRHWHKEYVNYYGKRVIGYRNTLTGGTNYDYQTLYQQ